MNKLYYLSSCSTCKRIINQWSLTKAIDLIDVKKTALDEKNLKELYKDIVSRFPKGNPKPCHKIRAPATSWRAMRLSQLHSRTPEVREPGPPLGNRKSPHAQEV